MARGLSQISLGLGYQERLLMERAWPRSRYTQRAKGCGITQPSPRCSTVDASPGTILNPVALN
jgi:hypothetical protein